MPDKLMSHDQDSDRRRSPDVMSYRLGAVERLSETNEKNLAALELMIREFVAGMPANYVQRREYDAHREADAQRAATVRLQWPVWALMLTNTLMAAVALLITVRGR